MSTMWTPAPQRNVLRQQEYRRWMMTTEPRKQAPKPALTLLPLDLERAADESWQMARRALDCWSPPGVRGWAARLTGPGSRR